MRAPAIRLYEDELIVDSFAGGGGASTGIEWATGRSPDIAVNHDPEAIAMHKANHPNTRHLCGDVFEVSPRKVCKGRRVGIAWFSPDCTFHSKARGGKPFRDRDKARRRRGLAWVVVKWAKEVRPRIIFLENVEEFAFWGPLLPDGKPCPERRGLSFRRWVKAIENAGYKVEMRELRACDYGAPTIRKRLFVVARCDGLPIVWPDPTHGKGLLPLRTAADCIEWSLPCPSIFGRKKPLAEKTMRRIARGVQRYVIDAAKPFLVPVTHAGDERVYSIDDPFRTITGAHRGEQALVTPFVAGVDGRQGQSPEHGVDRPNHTVTAKNDSALVAATLTKYHGGERGATRGQTLDLPFRTLDASNRFGLVGAALVRTAHGDVDKSGKRRGRGEHDVEAPLPTVCASPDVGIATAFMSIHHGASVGAPVDEPARTTTAVNHHAVVAAFLAKHYTGVVGSKASDPLGTVTTKDHNALVTSNMLLLHGSRADGQPVEKPLPTVRAQGTHIGEVRAFLTKYNGTADGQPAQLPLGTVTTKDRFGVVLIHGQPYAIVDIGMRMLSPRELFRAQGFKDNYVIDPIVNGKRLTKEAQVRMCGNSVCPQVACAIVRANLGAREEQCVA